MITLVYGLIILSIYGVCIADCFHVINNKTRKPIMSFCGEFHGCVGSQLEEIPIDIQAAFNLYDKDGNIEHIMPKDEED